MSVAPARGIAWVDVLPLPFPRVPTAVTMRPRSKTRAAGFLTFLGAVAAAVLAFWHGAEKKTPLFESEAHREQVLERLRQLRDATPE